MFYLFIFQTDMLVISCDFISNISLRKLIDVHKLHDSSVTMLLSAATSQADMAPGVKLKKKGIYFDRFVLVNLAVIEKTAGILLGLENSEIFFNLNLRNSFPTKPVILLL